VRWTNAELLEALKRYEHECEASGLAPLSVDSYVRYSQMFLRWRIGDYRPLNAVGPQHQPSREASSIEDLVADHRAYEADLRAARLRPKAVHTYLIHSDQFIRWLHGEFEPGIRLATAGRGDYGRPPAPPAPPASGDGDPGSRELCWCGCGGTTRAGSAFIASHDRIAEAAVIRALYGNVVGFLRHHGYGPGPSERHARDAGPQR
jgi:hypothetical protein